jgi:ankyrin repeat protein
MVKRFNTYEEIMPLIDLCKKGDLFAVQEWIASSKPVNPPLQASGNRFKSPLKIAIELGFHSLIKVLLDGGADTDEPRYSPLEHALNKRRLDLVQLLIEHGVDIHSVSMSTVFETWQPDIMKWFIEHGADVEKDNPMAYALCNGIRSSLGILKRYMHTYPSFQEQANIALRYYCREGNIKWVSLMLWAGADPYAKGPDFCHELPDPENDRNALELAAGYRHFDIFNLKKISLDPNKPELKGLLLEACYAKDSEFLESLLLKGFNPGAYKNCGSALIQTLLRNISWYFDIHSWNIWEKDDSKKNNLDNSESREKIKMIHLLTKNAARWLPVDRSEINDTRRSLLKMKSDYTVEFIWIMSKYKACRREDLEELIRTPSMKKLLYPHQQRIKELLGNLGVHHALAQNNDIESETFLTNIEK